MFIKLPCTACATPVFSPWQDIATKVALGYASKDDLAQAVRDLGGVGREIAVVDTQDASCSAAEEGIVRYNRRNKQLELCTGVSFQSYASPVGSVENPGASCAEIKDRLPSAGSGVYKIGKPTNEVDIYCDLSEEGVSLGGNGKTQAAAAPSCITVDRYFGLLSGVYWIGATPESAVPRYTSGGGLPSADGLWL